jgi:hypothetical protein
MFWLIWILMLIFVHRTLSFEWKIIVENVNDLYLNLIDEDVLEILLMYSMLWLRRNHPVDEVINAMDQIQWLVGYFWMIEEVE